MRSKRSASSPHWGETVATRRVPLSSSGSGRLGCIASSRAELDRRGYIFHVEEPEVMEPRDEAALADWENEGGSIEPAARDPAEREHTPFPPSLPSGYEAHSVWDFSASTGSLLYQFNCVYKRSDRIDSAGPICLLDEDMSYWSVTWIGSGAAGEDRRESRWVSYSKARKSRWSRLTFDRFSSLLGMRDELPELLRVHDLMPEQALDLGAASPHEATQREALARGDSRLAATYAGRVHGRTSRPTR